MKKAKFIFGIVVCLCLTTITAQERKSLINLNAGIAGSLGSNKIATPSFNASYEYFLSDSFSLGVLAGYSSVIIPKQFGQEEEKTAGFNAGVIANWYLSNSDTFDLYFGTVAGYDGHKYTYIDGGLLFEFHAGTRYKINDGMSINAELGYGLALLKLGVSFKL